MINWEHNKHTFRHQNKLQTYSWDAFAFPSHVFSESWHAFLVAPCIREEPKKRCPVPRLGRCLILLAAQIPSNTTNSQLKSASNHHLLNSWMVEIWWNMSNLCINHFRTPWHLNLTNQLLSPYSQASEGLWRWTAKSGARSWVLACPELVKLGHGLVFSGPRKVGEDPTRWLSLPLRSN